jgi:ubiquinone/menaquinone biosynthesis C-methylase UbiE
VTGNVPDGQESRDQQQSEPAARLQQLLFGSGITQAISVAAVLGLPDHIASGTVTPDGLAAATGTHEPSLRRLLLVLVGIGVVTIDGSDTVGLTAMGDLLRTDRPDSRHAQAVMRSTPGEWAAWGALLDSVRDGRSAFSHANGIGFFGYLDGHPEAAALFQAMMAGMTWAKSAGILQACRLPARGTVVDVGGGQGIFMSRALKAYPEMRGVVLDVPQAIDGARERLQKAGVLDRCRLVPGDFLEEVPPGGDVYTLVSILHNWDDEHAEAILRTCRRAMRPDSRLIIAEWMLPPGSEPHPSRFLDLQMLVLFGGRERTQEEFRDMLRRSGFELSGASRIPMESAVIEARAVPAS